LQEGDCYLEESRVRLPRRRRFGAAQGARLHRPEKLKLRGRILDRNGVVLAESTQEKVRHYPLKTLAAHVLGYTGKSDHRKDPILIGLTGVGFGKRYGIVDNEGEGVLPSSSWLSATRPGGKWSDGRTASVSIGQGRVLVTPLQMAVLAATVGNVGKVPQPSLLKNEGKARWRADLIAERLPATEIEQLREGMRLVVNSDSGTGKAAKSDQVIIAGKTSTAQNWRMVDGHRVADKNAWFMGFAPFDQPTLAFAILKQGGKSGGGDCGPIAKRIVEEALALPADGSGEVKPVGDAAGDAWEKTEAQRSAFDAKAAAVSSAIQQAKLDAKTGFVLTELKIGHGEVTMHGRATGMIEALEFRSKLEQIGSQFEMEWEFPVPQTMEDGKRVEFQARGIYQPIGTKNERTQTASGVLPQRQAPFSMQKEAPSNPARTPRKAG